MTTHRCDNCDGIDPASCLFNRPQQGAETPAATIQRAAQHLRQLATEAEPETVSLRDTPWHAEECATQLCACIVAQGGTEPKDYAQPVRYIADVETPELAAFIAAMDPRVGLALADWLDDAAAGDDHGEINPYALAVARQILGETA